FSEDKPANSSTVCLCRLGVICLARRPSGYDMYQREEEPIVTAMLFQSTVDDHCDKHWTLPATVDWRQEGPLDPYKWGFRFLEHVVYCTLKHVALEWVKLIRYSEMHVANLVSHNVSIRTPSPYYRHLLTSQLPPQQEEQIYQNPEDETWGDQLWRCSRSWSAFTRLMSLHVQMVSCLEVRAADFLEEFRRDAAKCQRGKAVLGEPLLDNGCVLFRLPKSLEASQTELKTALQQPTANMLDMVYKRVAIRDARNSLALNQSLWRLSWITFLFLPLTFITGVFGMNVDIFADNPSIKWWFAAAIPLMVLVLFGWYLSRSYVSDRQQRKKLEYIV
ncbi:hypothetical protein PG984_009031, partial [Apiospora sp. TS-2023a]